MKCRIALAQCEVSDSPEKNRNKAEQLIKKAAQKKAHIIVFPEYFVTGTKIKLKTAAAHESEYIKAYQELAKKYKIDVVPGSMVHEDDCGRHNMSVYIDSEGNVVGNYRKVHLWLSERASLADGHRSVVFNTKHGKIGLIICWDLMFPEIFRKMARKGVELVICPSYWSDGDCYSFDKKYGTRSDEKIVDALCVERAFENEVVLAYCNGVGRVRYGKKNEKLIGHSQMTMPLKGVVKKAKYRKEELVVANINTTILKDAEKAYKIRSDLKKTVKSV